MFGENFVWGVASSAYQIEGRAEGDGCGTTVWDTFCEEGRVFSGHNAQVACDHIHKYPEDFALMKALGIKHYRFSFNWARILPGGTGTINQKGIDLYKDMIREMKKNDIVPYITMFHWEFPQALQDMGGWLNPESVNWFGEYAKVVAENFGEDCDYFITFNEPECFTGLGYLRGEHAPGFKLPPQDVFQITHNVLKAHGHAVKMLRKYAGRTIQIGYAPTCGVALPATNSPEDIEAAKNVYFSLPELDNWTWNVSWFMDPVFLGHYPEEGLQKFSQYLPKITREDMELIAQPLDFMCQNIYNGYLVKKGANGQPEYVDRYPGFPKTAISWPVTPECLYWGSRFLYERYQMPLYITENGMSCHDTIDVDGRVHDRNRIDFLEKYLYQVQRAIEDGVDLRGYFQWTFLDNFEWANGYNDRFGLIFVDYQTQQRYVKDSAFWFQKVIESNGKCLALNQKKKEILFLNPILKENVWGGKRLVTEFPYESEGDSIGECWAISAHPNGDCVVREGEFQGQTLSKLYANHRELFGNIASEEFPLLIKIIDAKEDLSIQVHPDDSYAKAQEGCNFGKTECWYVMDCPENASLVIGHHANTREELAQMIAEDRYHDLIREVPIKKGDFIQIDPGTVHAIKGGFLILETQQNSDITYRVYDYGRLVDGKPRQLHVQQSIDVINVPDNAYKSSIRFAGNLPVNQMNLLVESPYYKVWKLSVQGNVKLSQDDPFLILSVLDGNGIINGRPIYKGDHMLLPYEYGEVELVGNMDIILSSSNE